MAALRSKGYDVKSPKLEVDEETDPNFPSFMDFGVYYNTPERLATIAFFAVNPKTADLWDTGLCKQVITKSVRRLQETLQMRYQLGTAQKGTLHAKSDADNANGNTTGRTDSTGTTANLMKTWR
jgi:hypothetical protein